MFDALLRLLKMKRENLKGSCLKIIYGRQLAYRSVQNANRFVKEEAKKIVVSVAQFAQGRKRKALIFAGSACMSGKDRSQIINAVS